jgi:hypothetical protein
MKSWIRTVHGSAGGAGRAISASAVAWLMLASMSWNSVDSRPKKNQAK